MKKILTSLFCLITVLGVAHQASAHLRADRVVLNHSQSANISIRFSNKVSGDLYLATIVEQKFVFITLDTQGKTIFSETPVPYKVNADFSGVVTLLNVNALNVASGRYPLYAVVVSAGKDPFVFTNWVGGLDGLYRLNFSIGLPNSLTHDMNDDGFPDDDSNHDGYSDDCRDGVVDKRKGRDHDKHESNDHDEDDDDEDSEREHSGQCGGNSGSADTGASNSGNSNSAGTVSPSTNTDVATGKANYQALGCASCHGSSPESAVQGATLSQLKSAIARVRGMQEFQSQSDTVLQSIVDYLSAL